MIQLFVGLIAEGTSDHRFLEPIVEKTLLNIAYDCKGQVDIIVKVIECSKGDSFTEYVLNAAQKGHEELGINMLIVHTDADDSSSVNIYNTKINPTKKILELQSNNTHCKNLIPLIPVRETESWMLADKVTLKKTIDTKKSDNELNINGNPENFNNPKERIEEAIRIGRSGMPKRFRDNLTIKDLYSYLGQATQIEQLKSYISYQDFENNIRKELEKLNLL